MKYKVGDKVRVINVERHCLNETKNMLERVCEIKDIYKYEDDYYVVWQPDKKDYWYFKEDELQLVDKRKRGRPRKGEEKKMINCTRYTYLTDCLNDPDQMACVVRAFIDFVVRQKGQKIGVGEAHIRKFVEKVFTKIELNEKEFQLLKILPKEFKYLARNQNGNLNAYTRKPRKRIEFCNTHWIEDDFDATKNLRIFNNLFEFIKFDDEEPYEIAKLLELEVKE